MKQAKHSTNDQAVQPVDPRGLVETEVDGRLVRNIAIGPFNEALFVAYAAVHVPTARAMAASGPWIELYQIRNSALTTPQTLHDYTQYLKQVKADGLAPCATAFVFDGAVEGVDIMKPRHVECFAQAELEFAMFDDPTEAEDWLRKKLADA